MQSLLYVSRRQHAADASRHDVDDIVAISRPRNAALDLTGALIATPDHFAQVLEGRVEAIEEVMVSIRRDARHSDILATPLRQHARREFHRWSLAYHGESTYVSGLVASALAAPAFRLTEHADSVRNLIAMLA